MSVKVSEVDRKGTEIRVISGEENRLDVVVLLEKFIYGVRVH
jgi:hypothetical protein